MHSHVLPLLHFTTQPVTLLSSHHSTWYSFTLPLIHSLIHLSIDTLYPSRWLYSLYHFHSLIHPFIHLYTHPISHFNVQHSLTHSIIHSIIHPFIHSYSLIQPTTSPHSFTLPLIHLFILPFMLTSTCQIIYSFVHSLTYSIPHPLTYRLLQDRQTFVSLIFPVKSNHQYLFSGKGSSIYQSIKSNLRH